MTLWAVSSFRNEADIATYSLRAMARQVDGIIIADNLSDDGTSAAFSLQYAVPVIALPWTEDAWYQGARMRELGRVAAQEYGAKWVLPFDADELFVAHDRIRLLKELVAELEPGVDVLRCAWYRHPGLLPFPQTNPFAAMGWRAAGSSELDKVMYRYAPDVVVEEGNHGIRGNRGRTVSGLVECHHFPYRSLAQGVNKTRRGESIERAMFPNSTGWHWRKRLTLLREGGEEGLVAELAELEFTADPAAEGYVWDPVYPADTCPRVPCPAKHVAERA